MRQVQWFTLVAVLTTLTAANAQQCAAGLQPYATRCVTQRMADYISCVEASGGNRQEITEELRSLTSGQVSAGASAAGGNRVVSGSANLTLGKAAESALVKRLENRWFPGGTSECAKVLTQPSAPSKVGSRVEIVDHEVSYDDKSDVLFPKVDLKLRNTGDQVAFIKQVVLNVAGEATFEDCREPRYSLVEASATYELDILKNPTKSVSHEVKPDGVDRIMLSVGRKEGGPTLTVYKVVLSVIYDRDNKRASSKPFFLRMVGPTVPAAMTILGVDEASWNACVARNKTSFGKIGYQIYKD